MSLATFWRSVAARHECSSNGQHCSCPAIEAAKLEKIAAEDAVEAAQLAKQEISKDRTALDQVRTLLAAAREEVELRSAAAAALLAKTDAKKAAAEQAREEAARQQVVLAEQIATLEAAKEAATIRELAAEQAHVRASVERKAADRAKATAESARQDAASTYEYVRSVLQQLRDTHGKFIAPQDLGTAAVKVGSHQSETTVE